MEQRLLINQPGLLKSFWEVDGEEITPAAPVTVTVTRDSDSTAVVTNAATTPDENYPSLMTCQLTAAENNKLDWLKCVWTAADGSTMTTYADVSGGFLFPIAAARQMSPLGDTNTYSTERLLFYRMMAEEALEDICGVCFVPRYRRERAGIASYGVLGMNRTKISNVRQITTFMVNQSANPGDVTANQRALPTLAGIQVTGTDQIFLPVLWSWWSQPVFVAYESGYVTPPPRVGRAAMLLARRWVVESPWDERTTALHSAEGGSLSILADASDPFDIPEVNSVANRYGTPMVV